MCNYYNCTLYSHTSYAMHTDHHHHTYESPKQYYSIQLSHTFSNDNIVLPCTGIIIATSLKKISRDSYVIGQAQRRDFSCHLLNTKRTQLAKPAIINAVVAVCGATVLVSLRPFKSAWGALESPVETYMDAWKQEQWRHKRTRRRYL